MAVWSVIVEGEGSSGECFWLVVGWLICAGWNKIICRFGLVLSLECSELQEEGGGEIEECCPY